MYKEYKYAWNKLDMKDKNLVSGSQKGWAKGSELLKVPKVPSILNWTPQMFLKCAVVSTNTNKHHFLAERFKDRNNSVYVDPNWEMRGNKYPKVYSWSNSSKIEEIFIKIEKLRNVR